ncbi:MAG TPA: endonuclease/exonuclease/phosphatase family protein [Actinomycetota bacterium]|nr:endonuclease/exonuclease/phosphatase family protein [Actinomycetota bacterium]
MSRKGVARRVARTAAVAVLLSGSTLFATARAQSSSEPLRPEPVELGVSTFNIEYGGAHVSFDKIVQAIRRGGADVVGIEEGQGHIPRLARALGWPFFSTRLQIVSRLPLIDPPDANGRYVFVETSPGRVVAIENVHLPSSPYGPGMARRGSSRAEIVDVERRVRLPEIRPFLRAGRALVEQGIPVFLVGDFNSPSWRDWAPEMVGARPQIRFPLRWPVSVAVERSGFVDSYRDIYPDPARDPGLTWWADRPDVPGWDPWKGAPQDRIDLVYAAGRAEATDSIIVGERGVPWVDRSVRPWPTDHRGVVSTFSVRPGRTPTLVAVERRLSDVGRDVLVRFHASQAPAGAVAVVPAGGDPIADQVAVLTTGGAADGTLAFVTDGWTPGSYEAVLLDGNAELSRIAFWLQEPGGDPSLETSAPTYAEGEPIGVTWRSAPGQRWDWIGVYKRGRDPRVAWYLLWLYTGATVEGQATLDASSYGPWPLEAGRYSVYLLADDGYKLLARADFEVVAP